MTPGIWETRMLELLHKHALTLQYACLACTDKTSETGDLNNYFSA